MRKMNLHNIKLKKILLNITVLICLSMTFSGCSHKTCYGKEDYSEIWECAGFYPSRYNLYEISALFPESIDELNVEKYDARYDEHFPLGEGFQILLSVKYEDVFEFDTEVERIRAIAIECSEQFEISDFNFLAYATILGWEDTMEYAIINTDEQKIYYVYVQCTEKKEIEFDHKLLPKNYPELGDVKINIYD